MTTREPSMENRLAKVGLRLGPLLGFQEFRAATWATQETLRTQPTRFGE